MRSPPQNYGGSVLSMQVQYNESQAISVNLMNTDSPDNAWVSTLMANEFSDHSLGLNYTTVANGSGSSPWNFTEYCFEWTPEAINYFVAGNNSRTIPNKNEKNPSVPATFFFQHWSTGNVYSSQGPPNQQSHADVSYVRMFFNSTASNDNSSALAGCSVSSACSVDNFALRGATPFGVDANEIWVQEKPQNKLRVAAIWISVISISFTTALLIHTIIRRQPWKKTKAPAKKQAPDGTPIENENPVLFEIPPSGAASRRASSDFGTITPVNGANYGFQQQQNHPYLWGRQQGDRKTMDSDAVSLAPSFATTLHSPAAVSRAESLHSMMSIDDLKAASASLPPMPALPSNYASAKKAEVAKTNVDIRQLDEDDIRNIRQLMTTPADQAHRPVLTPHVSLTAFGRSKAPPKARIDYLAGLVAFSSLLVTVIHFGLTFVPAMISPGAFVHYESEVWAERTVAPLFLTFSWVGIFFTTSTRFLVARYLKAGDLANVAEKTIGRAPRLMIPVAAIALIEYFVMNCGATAWLEYLPSVTWSDWPYTTLYANFGEFISELLELAFLIPNWAPKITFHYCTGVLWTIPVQLQGSWVVLLGAIVLREIKTTWKRMLYYFLLFIINWYARSWGTFLYLGLFFTDLDIKCKYKEFLAEKKAAYYGLMTLYVLMCVVGLVPDVAAQWGVTNFSTLENNIHPDLITGQPLGDTPRGGYPSYLNPRFSAFIFVAGFQGMVEICTPLQKALSFNLLMKLFPHILTIYLIHGLVFWSLGAWIAVHLSQIVPYWANMLIVALCCYTAIFLSLPFMTPLIDTLGKQITAQIWEFASQEPAPRRRSLFPFSKDLFLNPENFRPKKDDDASSSSSPSLKPFAEKNFADSSVTLAGPYSSTSGSPNLDGYNKAASEHMKLRGRKSAASLAPSVAASTASYELTPVRPSMKRNHTDDSMRGHTRSGGNGLPTTPKPLSLASHLIAGGVQRSQSTRSNSPDAGSSSSSSKSSPSVGRSSSLRHATRADGPTSAPAFQPLQSHQPLQSLDTQQFWSDLVGGSDISSNAVPPAPAVSQRSDRRPRAAQGLNVNTAHPQSVGGMPPPNSPPPTSPLPISPSLNQHANAFAAASAIQSGRPGTSSSLQQSPVNMHFPREGDAHAGQHESRF